MMNHARLSVALQGVAHASRATAIARAYSLERVQGKGAVIATHPDVSRMLDEMDVLAVGARGIAHLALVKLEGGDDPDLIELLTPTAKYFCTEAGSKAADLGIQVLGGYGYLEEYGMAQILRDVRISRIYEGTNGIHALSLATRLTKLNAPLQALDQFASGVPEVARPLELWREAWQTMSGTEEPRALADAFMRVTAELVHQIVWVRIAESCDAHSDPSRMKRLSQRAKARFSVSIAQFGAENAIS